MLWRVFSGGFWASNSAYLYWMCFRCFRVCVFVWIYLSDSGSSFFLPFSGLWGRCFGVCLFFSPLPPSSSPFLLLGPARVFFLCVRVGLLAGPRPHEDGAALAGMSVLFFSSALSARAGLPLPRPFSFLLSLFLFLSCMRLINTG